MTGTQFQGTWMELRDRAREKWPRLTDDDLSIAYDDVAQLANKIAERYGCKREEALREVNEFVQAHS